MIKWVRSVGGRPMFSVVWLIKHSKQVIAMQLCSSPSAQTQGYSLFSLHISPLSSLVLALSFNNSSTATVCRFFSSFLLCIWANLRARGSLQVAWVLTSQFSCVSLCFQIQIHQSPSLCPPSSFYLPSSVTVLTAQLQLLQTLWKSQATDWLVTADLFYLYNWQI